MRKFCALLLLLAMIFTLTACDFLPIFTPASDEDCKEHIWSEYKHNEYAHWREYICGCPWPELVEEHINIDGDLNCDVCGRELYVQTWDAEDLLASAAEKMSVSSAHFNDGGYCEFLEKIADFSAKFSEKAYERYGEGKNISVSPISVYMALALVCECADGETREEVLNAVGVTYEEVNKYTKYLYALCNQEFYAWDDETNEKVVSGYELLTNSIWLDDEVPFKNTGVQKLANDYNCDVFQTDFDSDKAKQSLKAYIEEKTRGLIDGTLPVDADTVFVLLNTFYLKEAWTNFGEDLPFSSKTFTFTNYDGTTVDQKLLISDYTVGKAQSFDTYSVYYAETSNGLRLYFVVPCGDNTVSDVFTQENIKNVLSINDWQGHEINETDDNMMLVCHKTRVFFPEFEAEFAESINDILKEDFSILSLFNTETCNMSNVTDGNVYCSGVVHKSKLKVDKTGIEGAAITAAIMAGEAADPFTYEYHDFVVDRSFGFILTDRYGTVLFSGAVNNIE